jgi:hypothetical protein
VQRNSWLGWPALMERRLVTEQERKKYYIVTADLDKIAALPELET